MTVFPIELTPKSNVLVVGAGGGFDIVCGLPIALELSSKDHNVILANYSFTDLQKVTHGKWHSASLIEVNAESAIDGGYFPELCLARWFGSYSKKEQPVYCFPRLGVRPLIEAYRYLIKRHNIDCVICVDGGVDGIFRGDETDLGTPSMDSISVIATHLSTAKQRIYVSTGFGVEGAEGKVSYAQALNRMSELIGQNAFLGIGNVLKQSDIGKAFIEASQYIFNHNESKSTIVSSIIASMLGSFGRTPVNEKTQIHPPWLSPLTSLYWYFEADAVSKIKIFYADILETSTVAEVSEKIEEKRAQFGVRPFENIPI